jgi:phosphoglycerol geranylgeranyltransferase
MSKRIIEELEKLRQSEMKGIALLIDPDKTTRSKTIQLTTYAIESGINMIFVGGSMLSPNALNNTLKDIRSLNPSIPVVIFPGNNNHINSQADGILLLNLISGRNPDLLIGQHVTAAPLLKKSGLEILPTGYLLIDGGKQTSVSYVSNTQPIPADKAELAARTALAGEQLGLRTIFMDAGSGALNPVSREIISKVRKEVSLPIIIGGGLTSTESIKSALNAGADLVVVGNKTESHPSFLLEAMDEILSINKRN